MTTMIPAFAIKSGNIRVLTDNNRTVQSQLTPFSQAGMIGVL